MTVREIVKKWLVDNGYGGLVNDMSDCGCEVDDLMPCDSEGCESCEAGYKVFTKDITQEERDKLDDYCDWVICLKKPIIKTCSTCKHYNPANNEAEFQCPIKHDEISEPDEDSCDKWEGR